MLTVQLHIGDSDVIKHWSYYKCIIWYIGQLYSDCSVNRVQ